MGRFIDVGMTVRDVGCQVYTRVTGGRLYELEVELWERWRAEGGRPGDVCKATLTATALLPLLPCHCSSASA